MQANPGDRIVVAGHRAGDPGAACEVVEVRGPGGGPPYLVRWVGTGHETLLFPGSDATVEHAPQDGASARRAPARPPGRAPRRERR